MRPSAEGRVDIDWERMVGFIERLQNDEDTGPEHAGGITYKPGSAKAGTDETPDGSVVLRSSGSMTYSGLLSMIYADLDRDDPRVRSAYEWARRHWSVEQNPGVGASGLYFYLRVMARAMDAYGTDRIVRENGGTVRWRRELMSKLVDAQKTGNTPDEGYWVNDESNRFWEGDPVLVTAYSILALQTALGR